MNHYRFSEEIERVLTRLPQEEESKFRTYFDNAPAEVLSMLSLEKRYADRYLVEESDPIDRIYILLEGQVKAVDFRVKGASYEFAVFAPVTFFGSMECLFGLEHYATTLVTDTACTLMSMPKVVFEKWLLSNPDAMKREAVSMRNYLLERTRESRVMMMLNGTERLMYLLTRMCEMQGQRDEYLLAVNRQELAEQSGSSVKTVNRSMKKLEESDMVLRVGHKVKVTQNQYLSMKTYLDGILNYTDK